MGFQLFNELWDSCAVHVFCAYRSARRRMMSMPFISRSKPFFLIFVLFLNSVNTRKLNYLVYIYSILGYLPKDTTKYLGFSFQQTICSGGGGGNLMKCSNRVKSYMFRLLWIFLYIIYFLNLVQNLT